MVACCILALRGCAVQNRTCSSTRLPHCVLVKRGASSSHGIPLPPLPIFSSIPSIDHTILALHIYVTLRFPDPHPVPLDLSSILPFGFRS